MLNQYGNSSSGYIDWRGLTNVTVYESIGFKYLCVGVQVSVRFGAGSVGCGPLSHPTQSAQVSVSSALCSTGGRSPASDFSSNLGMPTCFLKLTNTGTGVTGATSCPFGSQTGTLLSARAKVPQSPVQISSGESAYVECQPPSSISVNQGSNFAGGVQLTNGATAEFGGIWTA